MTDVYTTLCPVCLHEGHIAELNQVEVAYDIKLWELSQEGYPLAVGYGGSEVFGDTAEVNPVTPYLCRRCGAQFDDVLVALVDECDEPNSVRLIHLDGTFLLDDLGEVWCWANNRIFHVGAEIEGEIETNGYRALTFGDALNILIDGGYIDESYIDRIIEGMRG